MKQNKAYPLAHHLFSHFLIIVEPANHESKLCHHYYHSSSSNYSAT